MATILKLGSINLDNNTWSIDVSSVNTGSDQSIGAAVTVAEGKATSQHLGNYGSLKLDSEGVLTLQGGSDLKGDIAISGNGASVLSAVSFGAAVSVSLGGGFDSLTNVKMGGGADAVTLSITNKDFNLNTGAGNDTVIIETVDASSKIDLGAGNDLVSVTGLAGEVVLGAGKDTLKFGNTATVTASDYNFNDDVIVLDNATLTDDGKLTATGIEVNGLTAANGVYFAKVNGTGAATTILATAEEDAGKVVITDTVSKKENVIIIDAESADSANITLGKASLASVALKAGNDAVDTIKIGDTKATVNAVVTGFATDDVLNFTGLTFANTSIGSVTGGAVTLGSGKVSLNLGTAATVTGGAKFNLNGTTLYATTDNNVLDLTEETDLSKILIKGQNDVSVKSGIKTSAKLVNLAADNIYNIDYVELTADTAAKASVIGTKNDKAGITIDASEATDGVAVWANNSSTKKGDLISLSASTDVADTLWFGSADGKDSVANFSLASDVLYLYDATNMTAENGVLKVGKAEMSVMSSATEEIMQVQGAKFAGTVYAAGDFTYEATDDVIYLGENAGKVNYYAVGKDAKVSLTSAMTDSYTFLNSIDYAGATKANIAAGGSVASIDASAITETDAKVIIEGVANVTLGAGTNEYWANGAKDAVVALNGIENVDKIWFSASDKKVTVSSGFETESDVIALMGSIGEFTAKVSGTDAVISNANKGALTITGVTSDINLVDANGAKYKLYVDDANYTTNTDGTNIYLGTQLNASSEVTAATNIVVEGANNKWGIASSAIVGKSVQTIDMSDSSADFVLIGSANAANTITGGTGTNYLNGGGASKDVLTGNTGVDFFYYGKEDGNDTIVNIGAEDIVQLYDVATADLVNVNVKDDKTVITLNNNSKLTINNSIADGATFVLTDGTYVFDSSVEGNWVQK